MASTPFKYPREYSFPPFFTRQTNLVTLAAQRKKWSSLILDYTRHHRLFRLRVSDDSELFHNERIHRRLPPDDVRDIFDYMRRQATVEFLPGDDVVLVYWRSLDEWAALIEQYVEDTAQKGSVLTLYELTQGDATRGTELHGLDNDILIKALNVLVKRGKAQIFGHEDSLGVKFF
ncbi:hypothetical protein CDD81_496 [Ophiocordyceps australis]|uniref:Vacuolar protein-sorting-associated protein 25 n=1 Tax=Ophiocordyceps australis TaxID=1399860 RepID=A0A2C5XXY0_9HYPO|nr:hypothetical protein CDD81_496 [Ophiocordyceps australis]